MVPWKKRSRPDLRKMLNQSVTSQNKQLNLIICSVWVWQPWAMIRSIVWIYLIGVFLCCLHISFWFLLMWFRYLSTILFLLESTRNWENPIASTWNQKFPFQNIKIYWKYSNKIFNILKYFGNIKRRYSKYQNILEMFKFVYLEPKVSFSGYWNGSVFNFPFSYNMFD